MKKRKGPELYPGTMEAEKERARATAATFPPPELIGRAPNYDAFPGWTPERVLAWLNVD